MAIIRAKTFRGYSSKPDDLIDNLEFAQDCNDVVIHKGDICNLPYAKKLILRGPSEVNTGFLETNINNVRNWFRFDIGNVSIFISDGRDLSTINSQLLNIQSNLNHPGLGLFFEEDSILALLKGKIFQLGNWLFINANTFKTQDTGLINNTTVQSRMIRITSQLNVRSDGIVVHNHTYSLVGIDAPVVAEVDSDSSGSYTGSFDFAFTFITNIRAMPSALYFLNTTKLGPNDIESNVASLGTNVSYTSKAVVFKLTLPPKLSHLTHEGPLTDHAILCGVYAKTADETNYRFVGFWPLTGRSTTGDYTSYKVTINQSLTQHISKTPPLFNHSVPYNGTSSVFFKDRVYRNTTAFRYSILGRSNLVAPINVEISGNLLQISPSINEEFNESPFRNSAPDKAREDSLKIANYRNVALSRTIGSDQSDITGLIEFLGQLIIFKDRETYHLTDDITRGSIRLLWPSLGCVNIKGGRGFIVVDNKLFFVAHDGVYMFTGDGNPVKISSAIEEDLLNITNYKYAILSVDFRYEHLYLSFLGEDTKFIFHYGESGGWTKATSAHEVLLDPDREYYYNTTDKLQKLAQLDVSASAFSGIVRNTFWRTGFLTLGDGVRNKKWNELTFETQTTLSTTQNVDTIIQDNSGNTLITDSDNTTRRIHLGLYNDGIEIRMDFAGSFKTVTPFRINGMSITGELRGRR